MRTPHRVAALAAAASALAVAMQATGTWHVPYAPNNWVFSHVHLARLALADGGLPLNDALFSDGTFGGTKDRFRAETLLPVLSLYATTLWHFWNGIPLHPALLAGISAFTGLDPEQAARVPVGAVAAVLLTFASARLVLAHARRRGEGDDRFAVIAPFAVAAVSAPFALEMRVLMPSVTVLLPLLLLHAMLRRALLADRRALPFGVAPLLLLPFWYYTMAYFVVLLFAGFVLFRIGVAIARARVRKDALLPLGPALLVPAFLVLVLFLNGTLGSHVHMASVMGTESEGDGMAPGDGPPPLDYGSHLFRQVWRSALLYVQVVGLFAGLAAVVFTFMRRVARTRAPGPARAVLAQWAAGGALFSLVIVAATNVSFLNRTVIYLTPLAAIALALAIAEAWHAASPAAWAAARAGLVALVAFGPVATAVIVLTATPHYDPADAAAFTWMEGHVPQDVIVYGPMEAGSVLFRAHGFTRATAFHPTPGLMETFWYGEDPQAITQYVASFHYFVLRDDLRVRGFEDFSPAREPLPDAAYAKFSEARDLQQTFDNGDVRVYRVAVDPTRVRTR